MTHDGLGYLRNLADRLLVMAHGADAQHQATAVLLALAELKGAADVLIFEGVLDREAAHGVLRQIR